MIWNLFMISWFKYLVDFDRIVVVAVAGVFVVELAVIAAIVAERLVDLLDL